MQELAVWWAGVERLYGVLQEARVSRVRVKVDRAVFGAPLAPACLKA